MSLGRRNALYAGLFLGVIALLPRVWALGKWPLTIDEYYFVPFGALGADEQNVGVLEAVGRDEGLSATLLMPEHVLVSGPYGLTLLIIGLILILPLIAQVVRSCSRVVVVRTCTVNRITRNQLSYDLRRRGNNAFLSP